MTTALPIDTSPDWWPTAMCKPTTSTMMKPSCYHDPSFEDDADLEEKKIIANEKALTRQEDKNLYCQKPRLQGC